MAYQNSAYGNSNYLEEKILSAGPLEIVAMLYTQAIAEVREARRQLAAGDIALRSKAISKVCSVIGELDGSLNMAAGGDLAERLRGLYRYCLVRLLDANIKQADEPLVEVLGLLSTLADGWHPIAKQEAAEDNPIPATGLPRPQMRGEWEADASDPEHSWTL